MSTSRSVDPTRILNRERERPRVDVNRHSEPRDHALEDNDQRAFEQILARV
jgi:hypothetical protein